MSQYLEKSISSHKIQGENADLDGSLELSGSISRTLGLDKSKLQNRTQSNLRGKSRESVGRST